MKKEINLKGKKILARVEKKFFFVDSRSKENNFSFSGIFILLEITFVFLSVLGIITIIIIIFFVEFYPCSLNCVKKSSCLFFFSSKFNQHFKKTFHQVFHFSSSIYLGHYLCCWIGFFLKYS